MSRGKYWYRVSSIIENHKNAQRDTQHQTAQRGGLRTKQASCETDIVILIMEYLGGIIAILGLLICISSLATKEERIKPVPKEIRKNKHLDPELQSAIEKTLKSS